MHRLAYSVLLVVLLVASSTGAVSARQDEQRGGADQVVFVQSNDPTNNQVWAYQRASDGTLTLNAKYDTGGRGGRVEGAMADPLATQGSLIFDRAHNLLIGVNAGSDTVYAFEVRGHRLTN